MATNLKDKIQKTEYGINFFENILPQIIRST